MKAILFNLSIFSYFFRVLSSNINIVCLILTEYLEPGPADCLLGVGGDLAGVDTGEAGGQGRDPVRDRVVPGSGWARDPRLP